MKALLTRTFLAVVSLFTSYCCFAQLVVTAAPNHTALAQRLVGDGVTISNVTFQGTIEDESGGKGQFTATAKLTNDRFEGQGTGTGGQTVTIIGRVDAPTPTVPKGRISATYVTSSRRFGRLVGELKS